MDDPIEEMLVEVRAGTRGFQADIATMRASVDGQLLGAFDRAGNALESGLVRAIRRGNLGFEELGRIATGVLDQIAARAVSIGLDAIVGGVGGARAPAAGQVPGGGGSSLGSLLGGVVGGLLGLPGRATGGPVSTGRGYLVGERGPELFVPSAEGRIVPGPISGGGRGDGARPVSVSIRIEAPSGTDAPAALQRSSRQVAAAVRRALASA